MGPDRVLPEAGLSEQALARPRFLGCIPYLAIILISKGVTDPTASSLCTERGQQAPSMEVNDALGTLSGQSRLQAEGREKPEGARDGPGCPLLVFIVNDIISSFKVVNIHYRKCYMYSLKRDILTFLYNFSVFFKMCKYNFFKGKYSL